MQPPPDDWYQSDAWDEAAQELFEAKLKRARSGRAHYVFAKGLALTGAGDSARTAAGRTLLQRVIDEYDDAEWTVASAYDELTVAKARYALADSLARDGRPRDAAQALRECLAMETAGRAAGRNFSNGTELRLAEVLIDAGDPSAFEEAWRLINVAASSDGLLFNSQIWRAEVARARLRSGIGDTGAAAEHAEIALSLLDRTAPQFPRHPDVGLITADDATVSEMRRIAAGSGRLAGREGRTSNYPH
jgi:hypothetical protein